MKSVWRNLFNAFPFEGVEGVGCRQTKKRRIEFSMRRFFLGDVSITVRLPVHVALN